jgi:hypothetical protein
MKEAWLKLPELEVCSELQACVSASRRLLLALSTNLESSTTSALPIQASLSPLSAFQLIESSRDA